MKMIKINMEHESMDSESEINELMNLCSSFHSYKEVNGEIIPLESISDLLDAYEYETDIFYFEVSNVENLGLEYLQIEKVNQDEKQKDVRVLERYKKAYKETQTEIKQLETQNKNLLAEIIKLQAKILNEK